MTIRVIAWNDSAEKFLAAVPTITIAELRRELDSGPHCQLWEFSDDMGIAGYAVTRLERDGLLYEWVWLACAGTGFLRWAREFMQPAYDRGWSIRAYVTRPGMIRFYKRLGFRVSATVMRRSY